MSGGCGSAPLGRFNVSAFRTRSLNFVRRLQMSEVRRNSGRGKSALPGVFFKFRSAAGGCGRTGNGVLFLELVRTDEEECRVFRTSVVARTCEEYVVKNPQFVEEPAREGKRRGGDAKGEGRGDADEEAPRDSRPAGPQGLCGEIVRSRCCSPRGGLQEGPRFGCLRRRCGRWRRRGSSRCPRRG